MSVFFCDTNSEIDLELLRQMSISLIKMPYTVDGEERYYDLGENTDLPAFFAQMRAGAAVKTQALNEYDYIEYFEPVLSSGEDIVYVSFSHKMSGTFASLSKAIEQLKSKYPERSVTVVDSGVISQGAALVVANAAKVHAGGGTIEQVVAKAKELSQRTSIYFTVESLEYLRKGGRLSKFKSFVGTLFNVKPIITTVGGALENTETAKGRKCALRRLVDILAANVDLTQPIIVLHADCIADAQLIVEMIGERLKGAEIRIRMIGPVIGCHCGPGTVGVAFVKN